MDERKRSWAPRLGARDACTCMPRTKLTAYSPLWYGSSPGVSTLRPQRGSRARLMTGAQKVEYACPAFMAARASMPMAAPVARQSERLKAMAVVMGKAKLVVETS